MEDDIDIEEHDVLDNPKIRDIFPDLSIVKTEVPDPDLEDQYEVNQEYELEYTYNIKNEVISDEENNCDYEQNEQSTSCVFEQSEQITPCVYTQSAQSDVSSLYNYQQNIHSTCDFNNSELNNSNSEYHNNKIILGSKPGYDVLYQEALHSTASVFLENWEFKLKNSPCYCNSCEILFPTVNALDAHKSISHSFLVALDIPRPNTARKSTVNTASRYCNHCDKMFPDDTALIKHLYELLPLNNFEKQTPQRIKVDPKFIQYKCIKCKKYFSTFANGKRHKKLAHPAMTNVNLIVRVPSNVDKPIPVVGKKREKEQKKDSDSSSKTVVFSPSLVPKSVLFQCHICHINFLSCYSTIQHANKCENKYNFHQCKICKRKIRVKDTQIHELQHKYAEKLKIYTIHRSILEKVLLKCPECFVCMDEKTFWTHRRSCDGEEIERTRCNICLIDIIKAKYENHKMLHISKKYTKKDFIVVEFCDTTKMSNVTNQVKQKPRLSSEDTDIIVYYCSCCGSYSNIYSLRGHSDGTCKSLSINYCELCGLGFGKNTFKQHQYLHSMKNLTLSDFKVISLQTQQQIEPPIPNFHQCSSCSIHFLTKEQIRLHNCDTEPFQTCKTCNKKFNLKALLPHSNFHSYKDIPELLKKYNSINNTWNLIYLCVACELVSLTYDSAVEHSQYHINDFEQPPTKYCEICDFNIIEQCFKSHMNLHENNETINRKEFTILKYDYKQLFNAEWMKILAPLSKPHKYQILSKSIYRYTRRFKLNIEINCRTDDMKYYCKRCKTNVVPEDIKQHYFNKNCKHSSKYVCKTCNTKHITLQECVKHEGEHENISKSYKVITFNDQKDELFDQRLKDYELSTVKTIESPIKSQKSPIKTQKPSLKIGLGKKSSKKLALNKKSAIKLAKKASKMALISSKAMKQSATAEAERDNRIKLYKCENCLSCISLRRNLHNHTCTTFENRRRLCRICNEYFYSRHLLLHLDLHRSLPHLPEKPLIIYFNPSTKTLPIATVFQCDCGLHFTSKISIENHLNICCDGLEVSKEMCSKCNLLFPTDVLVSHLCKHHSKPVDIKIERVTKTKVGPFLCSYCKVVYYSIGSFEDHLFSCPIRTAKKCPKCNYNFDLKTFRTHPCVIDQEMSVVKNTATVVKLYRCQACSITYLLQKSYDYHIVVNHVNKREIVACNICKLRFTGQTLNKHMAMHNPDEKYIIKVIDPATGHSSIIKGRNYKLDCVNKSPKRKESALNKVSKTSAKSPKKSIENVKNVTPKTTDQKIFAASDATCTVYRCTTCDICYLYKRRLDYHLEANHVTKRVVKPCSVCGLRFAQHILINHEPIHKVGETYKINVIQLDTGKIKVLTGKNNMTAETPRKNKRSSQFVVDSVSPKRAKKDSSEKFADQNNDSFANQTPSTSKFDFESVNMNDEDNKLTSDVETDSMIDNINIDPLNNSSESILPDVSDNSFAENTDKNFVSNTLKKVLNTHFDKYTNNLYICNTCKLHFLTDGSLECHLKRANDHKTIPVAYKCDICSLAFSKRSLPRHVYIHHTRMNLNDESYFNIVDIYAEENTAKSPHKDNLNTVAIKENKSKLDYFKCADCNVCFIDENTCRKHSINHVCLDPKTYIECKICNFQFLIDSLKKHMTLHHSSEFVLEDLVITEYTATGDRQPKIDIYRGMDKVQSRLVSTTSDMAAVNSSGGDIVGV